MKAKPAEGSGGVAPEGKAGNVPFPSMAGVGKHIPCYSQGQGAVAG